MEEVNDLKIVAADDIDNRLTGSMLLQLSVELANAAQHLLKASDICNWLKNGNVEEGK